MHFAAYSINLINFCFSIENEQWKYGKYLYRIRILRIREFSMCRFVPNIRFNLSYQQKSLWLICKWSTTQHYISWPHKLMNCHCAACRRPFGHRKQSQTLSTNGWNWKHWSKVEPVYRNRGEDVANTFAFDPLITDLCPPLLCERLDCHHLWL